MEFGTIIKETRKKKNISQGSFAESLGISQTYLSLIEKNKKKPSFDLLDEISKALNIPVYYFMFKGLEVDKDVPKEKREAYKQISPIIGSMIEKFFLDENDTE